jgi:hypothetical protein
VRAHPCREHKPCCRPSARPSPCPGPASPCQCPGLAVRIHPCDAAATSRSRRGQVVGAFPRAPSGCSRSHTHRGATAPTRTRSHPSAHRIRTPPHRIPRRPTCGTTLSAKEKIRSRRAARRRWRSNESGPRRRRSWPAKDPSRASLTPSQPTYPSRPAEPQAELSHEPSRAFLGQPSRPNPCFSPMESRTIFSFSFPA